MPIYTEWIDFITYPSDSGRIWTLAERLDVSHAVNIDIKGFDFEEMLKRGARMTLDNVLHPTILNQVFEVMEVTDTGNVTIWTTDRVVFLSRLGGIEKMIAVRRHPPDVNG